MHDPLLFAPDRTHMPDRRIQVRQVAACLWALHGYHAIPLRHIADKARVSLVDLQRIAPSKPALFALTLEEWSIACIVARRRLMGLQRGQAHWLDICDLASGLAYPVEQLRREGAHGRNLLLLWLRHVHDPAPELRAALLRTLLPLQHVVVSNLAQRQLHTSHTARDPRCSAALGAAIAITLAADKATLPEQLPDTSLLPTGLLSTTIADVLAAPLSSLGARCSPLW